MVLFTSFILALAVARVAAQNKPAIVYKSCTTPSTAALTFDDGPYDWSNKIVDLLDASNAKGTFFLNGNNYRCIYSPPSMARVKYAYERGHMIASHTWSHKNLTNLTSTQIDDEMARTEVAIRRITGALVRFMRPPYGSYNQTVLDVSGARGQDIVNWDTDPGDGNGTAPDRSMRYYNDVINGHPGTILALHHETISKDGHPLWKIALTSRPFPDTTVYELLPWVIKRLQGSGYRLVTVAECLGLPPYREVHPAEIPNSTWTC